jgi:hypothetical protein
MSNSSATGGYLTQSSSSIDGLALRRFLQSVIVGVTGLPAAMVRPMWQQNPPPVPSIDTNWCGFAIISQRPEQGAYHEQLNAGGANLLRHEQLDLLCAFYGPDCLVNAGILRDGLELIAQNREQLFSQGMGIDGFSDITHAPELVNDRFFDRADITMTVNREIRRTYNILHLVGAYGTIYAEDAEQQPLTEQINVSA